MMMETILSRSLRLMFSGGVALLGIGALAQPALAQQTDTTAAPVQRVEITGSSIRRVDTETPSPVQIITADDMKKSGYTSVSEVLQNITANGQGTLSQGFSQAFASGASGIALRGLTTAATLVLIDGHRMAPYPLADDNQRSFVDVSNIPFDTIERIEVLKDGASAIYGSDAMAGVVNIILKKSFIGTTINAEGGTTTEGGGQSVHLSVTHGFGDIDMDGYNAYGSIEYRHQNAILYSQRSGKRWEQTNWLGDGGNDRTLGNNSANPTPATLGSVYLTNPDVAGAPSALNTSFYPGGTCNLAALNASQCLWTSPHGEISPETSNLNLLASFSKRLNDGWKLDVKGSMFQSKAEQYPVTYPTGGLQTYDGGSSHSAIVAVSAGVNPFIGTPAQPAITVPVGYPGNPWGVPAYINGAIPDAPIVNTQLDSKAYRLVGDLTGTIGEWDITASLGYTKINTVQNQYGFINNAALQTAINRTTNPYNVLGGNSAADNATIFPSSSATDVSKLSFAELHASRPLATLAGGDLSFGTGASFIYTELDSPAPALVAQGIVNGNNAYVSGTQKDTAAYAEIVAPVLKSLELDAAVRIDHFDGGVGNATTPKFGFKWTPNQVFGLRGTYSTGFRAPNAAESGNSGNAYLADTTNDPILCPGGLPGGGGNIAAGSVIAYCNFQPPYLNSSSTDLKPEKSKSGTLGVILEPIKGWSSTLDVYQIKIDNQIVTGPPGDAVRNVPQTQLCADGNGGQFSCAPGTGDNTVGSILYYPNFYINANSVKTSGLELESRYKFKMGEYGSLTTSFDWSHTMSYILTTDGQSYQLAGTHGPFIIGGDTGNPKDRIQASFTYDKNAISFTTTFNWISSFDLTDPSFGLNTCDDGGSVVGWFSGNVPSQYCHVASFLDTDMTLRYIVSKQLLLHVGVLNVFNRQAPLDFNTYGGGQFPVNPSMHLAGMVGRSVNAGLTYSF